MDDATMRTTAIILLTCGMTRGLLGQEMLYGTNSDATLATIDPHTGIAQANRPISGLTLGHVLQRAAHDGTRMFARNGAWDQAWRLHPADARVELAGTMGSAVWINQNYALEWVPTRQELVMINIDEIYVVDRLTGQATLQGWLTGLQTLDGILSMGFHPNGTLFGFGGTSAFSSRIGVYTVDLTAQSVTWLADLTVPTGARIGDVAFRSNGDLWASFTCSSPSLNGVYRIDLSSMSMSAVIPMNNPPIGIAFGPATETTSYCTAKINSNGCAPTILGNGIASLSASSGYSIGCVNVRNQTTGVLTYSFAGAANLPFGGGTMCVAAPRLRAGAWSSGGNFAPTNDCSGAWNFDFNTWASTHPIAPAGTTVWAQWIGRDSGFAPPQNYSLSNALQFTLVP